MPPVLLVVDCKRPRADEPCWAPFATDAVRKGSPWAAIAGAAFIIVPRERQRRGRQLLGSGMMSAFLPCPQESHFFLPTVQLAAGRQEARWGRS